MKKLALHFLMLISLVGAFSGCQPGSGMVMVLDPDYRPAIQASSENGISSPDGVLFHGGSLLVADEGGSACRKLEIESNMVTDLCDDSVGIRSPEDLVVAANGSIYFSDDDAGGVWVIEPGKGCRCLVRDHPGLIATEAIALSPDGDLLVGDGLGGQILRVSPTGEITEFLGPEAGISKPESMAFDDHGNLFIADNQDNVLYRWSATTGLSAIVKNRPDFSPESIAFAHGTLYITDSESGAVMRYSPDSGLHKIAVFGAAFRSVQGITADDRGNLYITVQTDLKDGIGYIVRLDLRSGTDG